MSFDPFFRFYRDDPQDRPSPSICATFAELDLELQRRRSMYPALVTKGRMTREDADRELRVWTSLFDKFALCEDSGRRVGADATWTEQIHCLRREIALRRRLYPQWIEAGRVDADEAERKLLVIEGTHQDMWCRTWIEEAVAARAAMAAANPSFVPARSEWWDEMAAARAAEERRAAA